MKKYFLLIFLITFWLNIQNVFSSCEYQSEINECVEANMLKWKKPNDITDYVCPVSEWPNYEEIAYQVIFDKKFKELDKEVENFLDTLQNSIQYFYWPEKKESYLDWLNYLNETFNPHWTIRKKYTKYCRVTVDNSIINSFCKCTWKSDNECESTIDKSKYYITQSYCEELINFKLYVYKKVAYNLLQVNKLDFLNQFRKKQLKSTREKYDLISWNMYANLDYIVRIYKWQDKVTPQCQNITPDGS